MFKGGVRVYVDGDLTPMIVARYLHRYNDDARPGTSMEAFLLFLSYELLYIFFIFVSYVSQCVCVCVSDDSVSFMSEFHEVWYPDMIGGVSGGGQFHIESS